MMGTVPHPTPGASFSPFALVRPRTAASYEIAVGNADMIAAHLVRQGWRREAPRSEHEVCRLRYPAGALVVLYAVSVLVQGSRPELAHNALAELVEVAR